MARAKSMGYIFSRGINMLSNAKEGVKMKNVNFKELANKARVKTQKYVDSHRGAIGLCVGTATGLYVGYNAGGVAMLRGIEVLVPEAFQLIKTTLKTK
jgi:hypothetical protein